MHNEGRHPLSLWVATFGLTAALQIFRGSIGDTIIFVGGTLLILLSTTLLRRTSFPSERLVSTKALEWAGLVLLACLAFTPRHSFFDLGIFVLILPLVVTLAWGKSAYPAAPPSARIRRTRNLWITWAVCLALWEFAANILGQVFKDPADFPTISVLIDPLLKHDLGQAGFVAVWLSVGYFLLKAGAK